MFRPGIKRAVGTNGLRGTVHRPYRQVRRRVYRSGMSSVVSVLQSGPVVVGVDGSRSTPAVLDFAVREAERHRAALLVLHVWPGRYTGVFRGRGVVPSPVDGRRLLGIAVQRARLAVPGLPVSSELVDGGAAAVLAEYSARARLLVVGCRDDVPARSGWGSTAAYLAHHSRCPLVVHRGVVAGDGPVVVAASARMSGAATVGYAFGEAALRGARLVVIHMWTRPGAAEGVAPVVVPGGYAGERAAAERALAGALAPWVVQFPQVGVERLVVPDLDFAYTVARASRRGRLLVAGIGRRGRFAELLYGSPLAGSVGMRQGACPAVFVPAGWLVTDPVVAGSGPAPADPL
jgi:nucleotide-binding universal stress UspA family protein